MAKCWKTGTETICVEDSLLNKLEKNVQLDSRIPKWDRNRIRRLSVREFFNRIHKESQVTTPLPAESTDFGKPVDETKASSTVLEIQQPQPKSGHLPVLTKPKPVLNETILDTAKELVLSKNPVKKGIAAVKLGYKIGSKIRDKVETSGRGNKERRDSPEQPNLPTTRQGSDPVTQPKGQKRAPPTDEQTCIQLLNKEKKKKGKQGTPPKASKQQRHTTCQQLKRSNPNVKCKDDKKSDR